MKWLVTTERRLDEATLDRALGSVGARLVDRQAPVPLGPEERVWEVEGPPNLDHRLAGVAEIREVSPSSDLTLY